MSTSFLLWDGPPAETEPTDVPASFETSPPIAVMLPDPRVPTVAALRVATEAIASNVRPWRERLTWYPMGYSYSMPLVEAHRYLLDLAEEGHDVSVEIRGDRWIVRVRTKELSARPIDLDVQREDAGLCEANEAHTWAEVQAA